MNLGSDSSLLRSKSRVQRIDGYQLGDEQQKFGPGNINSLDRSMRVYDNPCVDARVLGSLDRLSEDDDRVEVERMRIASVELDGLIDAERVGDWQAIRYNLTGLVLIEVVASLPVSLSQGMLWFIMGSQPYPWGNSRF